jgi:hypothetical protein
VTARTASRGAGAGVVLVAGLALGLGACSPNAPSSAPGTVAPTASPSATVGLSGSPTPTSAVAVDPSLLEVLPETVDGVPIAESADGEAEALADPGLGAVAVGVAAGLAVDAGSGEFVYVVVVRLRPGAMTDERFRDWRDSFDEGACSQAGGVTGNAEAQIGGRTVYIGSCGGGVRTYHAWLAEPGLLVSASAVGERRLGERLVEGLRP